MSSSLDDLLKLSKTTSPQKLFPSDCITLYYTGGLKGCATKGKSTTTYSNFNIGVLVYYVVGRQTHSL